MNHNQRRELWVERIERWEASGLSRQAFAELEGVKPQLLSNWKWELGSHKSSARTKVQQAKKRKVVERQAFVELLPSVSSSQEDSSQRFEVVLGNARVVVPSDLSGELWQRVLQSVSPR